MKINMKILLVVFGLAQLFGISSFAQRETGGGGDFIREGVILEGNNLLNRIDQSPAATGLLRTHAITTTKLRANLNIDVIVVASTPLIDRTGSRVDALYQNGHIYLSYDSWFYLIAANADVDQMILHELLRSVLFDDDNYILSTVVFANVKPSDATSDQILASAATHAAEIEQSQLQTPPTPGGMFGYNVANRAYQNGIQPIFEELLGTWKSIGIVELPGFLDSTTPDRFDSNGIFGLGMNSQVGSSHELVFNGQTAFDGSKQAVVQLKNLGIASNDQGPNGVTVTGLGACFSQWSYQSNFSQLSAQMLLTKDDYFHYACRLVSTRAAKDQLICAIQYQIVHPENVDKELSLYVGRTVYFVAYQR
jgi:hypothetical protein